VSAVSPAAALAGPLRAEGLDLSFGAHQVLHDVDIELEPGQITGLIGPNGAGKTSLFNCLTGLYRPQRGRILFGGVAVQKFPPDRRAGLGISRSFQHMALCPDLTVLENVMVGLTLRRSSGWAGAFLPLPAARAEDATAKKKSLSALSSLGIASAAATMPAELPPGTLRLVEIARAMVGEPRALLLDEPAAGLNAAETRDLMLALQRLLHPDLVVVVVEHDMDLIMQLCDQIYVLNFGRVIAHGAPSEVRSDPEVIRIYLGDGDD
jgi:branched-chain amino acid transport system ATP-binding protein